MTTANQTSQNPTRQHVVPRMLLKNFRAREGFVYAYNKRDSKHFKATPNNVFVHKDRYTQRRVENDDERYEIELRLGEIESQAAPVIDEIIRCRKAGRYPVLSKEDGDAVKLLLITMFLRTDHHADEIVPIDQYEQLFRQEFSKQGEIFGLDGAERQGWEDFQRGPEAEKLILEELIPDLRARIAAGLPPKIADQIDEFMLESGLLIAMPEKRASGFILGDCGGVRVFASDTSEAYHSWVPISREIIVGPTMDPENVTFTNLYRRDVNRINSTLFATSDVVVARRPSDLDFVLRDEKISLN